MNEFVTEMHTRNGLLEELAGLHKNVKKLPRDSFPSVQKVEKELLSWLNDLIPEDTDFPEIRLAGHSINSLDFPFIRHHMPELASNLSHRTLDISSQVRFFTDIAKIPNEKLPFGLREAGHRAIDDCEMALVEGQKYNEWVKKAFKVQSEHTMNLYVDKVHLWDRLKLAFLAVFKKRFSISNVSHRD